MQLFTDSLLYNIIGVVFALTAIVIVYFKWTFTYWIRRGLYGPEPILFFGNTKNWILQKTYLGEQFDEFYQDFKSKGLRHGGVYVSSLPYYIPVDIEIVKNILQKDFQHFVNHGGYINEKIDPISGHLFNLEDDAWKDLRHKLTPIFTSGKLKMMYQTMIDCTKQLDLALKEKAETKTPANFYEFIGRFTTDVIGSCAFGLECDCFNQTDNEFVKYGKRIIEHTPLESVQQTLEFFLPNSVLKFFRFKVTKSDVEGFFLKLVQDTIEYREKNNVYRNDFINLLMQLKSGNGKKIDSDGLTVEQMTAQCWAFFFAGFETTSTTMTFALFELAQNFDMQDRVRQEIEEVLKKHDGILTYEACMEMTYLEKVINETLRKYPPAPVLFRICTKDYKVPDSHICLENGTKVIIPVLSIHYDPDYYPDPEKFDPERFSEENKRTRPACTFLPFGEGPRICIGLRFASLQAKVGLVTILKNYKITLSKKTYLPIKFSGQGFILAFDNPIWLNIEKIG